MRQGVLLSFRKKNPAVAERGRVVIHKRNEVKEMHCKYQNRKLHNEKKCEVRLKRHEEEWCRKEFVLLGVE
jgi:hypothetical protein